MATKERTSLLNRPLFASRIKSMNIQGSEKGLGYFAGPALVYIAYYGIAGAYLTQFYTDVLGLGGIFMVWMPFFSKIVDAITNVLMGRIIDKTRTKQGKVRPWILLSGFLIAITGALLYAVPQASYTVQIVWVIVSYNLFFAFSFTIYNMGHALMVPLSTRNTKQRDTLAILTSVGTNMIPGLLVTVIMPVLISLFGVGEGARSTWLSMMSIMSALAIPGVLLEYYFSKERVTEDAASSGDNEAKISMLQQMKACIKDPYWLIIMGSWLIYQLYNYLSTSVMIYYSNWVLASSVDGGVGMQVLVNMIGQAPLGIGVVIMWPLVHKFGKQKVMMVGCIIGAAGSLMVLLAGSALPAVLAGLAIKSFGALPMTYIVVAMLAEALDHIEWKNHFRADGFSASVYSIIITIAAGIGQTVILGGISAFGYIAPESTEQIVTQPDAIRNFFTWCFVGVPMIGYVIGSLLMLRFDVEKKMPQIQADITARRRAEAEARGEVYYSPEEKAAMEQAENDRQAEENRIAELKAKCAKKGLNFAEEEAKYQAKLAAAKAKAAKKQKK